MYDFNTAPKNLEEYEQLIAHKVAEAQEKHTSQVTEITAQATAQWNKELPAKKAELLKSMTKTEANIQLAKDKEQFIKIALSAISPAETEEQIRQTYSFFLAGFETPNDIPDNPITNPIIKLDNRYYDVMEGQFVNVSSVDSSNIIILGCEPTLENLKEYIEYEHNNNSFIPLLSEEIITEEKFKMLRKARIPLLEEYDAKVMQLNRLIRENPSDDSYVTMRTAWDNYATALANITELPNAPFDGGGPETPWPAKPE